ncbi:MAG TPA: hypothetical protein VM600_01135 [Actinomycetota bacterium]|nr:hypothetical protein [Actinomycetota bacterium]
MIVAVLIACAASSTPTHAAVGRSETRPYIAATTAAVVIDIGGCLDPSGGSLASAPGIGGVCFPVQESNVPAEIRISDSYADNVVGGSRTVWATWRFVGRSGSVLTAGSFCGSETAAVPAGASALTVEVHGATRACGARLYSSSLDGGCRLGFAQLPSAVPTQVPGFHSDIRDVCSTQLHPPTLMSGGSVTVVFA